MDRSNCSEDCRARAPLGSDSHISTCPQFLTGLGSAGEGRVLVLRNEQDRPVAVPDEIVTEAEREYRAYKKHLAGKTWEQIATEEMYADAQAAAHAVKRYLDEGRAVIRDFTRQEIVAAHVGRLSALRAALWEDATTARKPQAVMAVLAIEDRWVKAFGLDQPDAEDTGTQTVVVPSEDYLTYLRNAAAPPRELDAG